MAHLARLNVDESEKDGIASSLGQILSWMEKLNELDTENVEPLVHMSAEINGFRKDEAGSPMKPADALKNSPVQDSRFFRVPKVIDL